MEELDVDVLRGPMRLRDEELPREAGRSPEGLLVEEVSPPADGLAERERRRHDVEVGPERESPAPDVEATDEDPPEEPAVDREAALPHGEGPPPGLRLVIVQVEDDVVEPGAHEGADQRELGGFEELVGPLPPPVGLAGGQPQPQGHGGGDEDPVPPDREVKAADERKLGGHRERDRDGTG